MTHGDTESDTGSPTAPDLECFPAAAVDALPAAEPVAAPAEPAAAAEPSLKEPARLRPLLGSPPKMGSPVRVTASGRVGKVIAEDDSDLPYKVQFEDGAMPQADWFTKGSVEALVAIFENGVTDVTDGKQAPGGDKVEGAGAASAAARRLPPPPVLGPGASQKSESATQDGDELDFTFGSSQKLELPQFGTRG
mmetsp:Transcript_10919/g.18593  ORF Transcript_10919/g.18593 Transcript_10919/m.18593 type:complete len:193 (+) Transcript_10919:302-880(+)